MDEDLYRHFVDRIYKIQEEVFTHPPKTMEEFSVRIGRWNELHDTIAKMKADAQTKEKRL
jgi:hypothetical protein